MLHYIHYCIFGNLQNRVTRALVYSKGVKIRVRYSKECQCMIAIGKIRTLLFASGFMESLRSSIIKRGARTSSLIWGRDLLWRKRLYVLGFHEYSKRVHVRTLCSCLTSVQFRIALLIAHESRKKLIGVGILRCRYVFWCFRFMAYDLASLISFNLQANRSIYEELRFLTVFLFK